MQHIVNTEIDKWIRPWNIEKFNELDSRDERFFSLVLKGALSWMNGHILMYDKPIKHFIFNTGSTYMYVESNGYEFKWSETSGEDWMYMETPRCLFNIDSFSIPTEELTAPYIRGIYERRSSTDGQIQGYNAEMRRLPIEITANLHYTLSNFNESIVLIQELYDKVLFQQYYNINYLGQIIECSLELQAEQKIEWPTPDLGLTDPNMKNITISIKICTNYPIINERTESNNKSGLIASALYNISAEPIDNENKNIREKDMVYRRQEGGYYSKFSKKFYKDPQFSQIIEPDLLTVYIDVTDEDNKIPYHWDGKEYMRDYDYDLLDSVKYYNSSSIDVN